MLYLNTVILVEKHDRNVMNLSTQNHAETRNHAIICNKNIRKMWFWRQFFVLLIKILIIFLFPGAGGLQKTPEKSLSLRSL